MTYKEVYEEWEYLFETVGVADDMTGGYVDSEDLSDLLKNPSKATAKKCLMRQIGYWFKAGIQFSEEHKGKSIYDLIEDYPRIKDISEDYGCEIDNCPNPFVREC